MAILWSRKHQGKQYEVRSAGATRRLYTDGVFHSQFNPRRPVSGSVWDLLWLPALFYPRGAIRRVLVLGVGGGAVIRQLQHFLAPEHITGVELNPVHLQVAKRFFGVKGVTLIQADARAWMKDYTGPPFDLIIDDLFGEEDGEPVRAIAADRVWAAQVIRQLNRGGLIVTNFVSPAELRASAYCKEAGISKKFSSIISCATPLYANAIGAFCRKPVKAEHLQGAMKSIVQMSKEVPRSRLNFQLKAIK